MLSISIDNVRMQATAQNKDEALQVLSEILVADGLASADYLQGLKDRETQSSTYLGQGIAIPHGTPNSRESIKNTGVRLVHFADGVVWNAAGDVVYLAVVIAAKSDEHLQILQQLTKALTDDVAQPIRTAKTAEDIIAALGVRREFVLQEALITTNCQTAAVDELYLQAAALLKKQRLIDSVFLPKYQPTRLSEALSCVVIENHDAIKTSALAVAVGELQALALIVANQTADKVALAGVLDVLMSEAFTQAVEQNDKAAMLALLNIESYANWASASVVLPNKNGLHARPATALAELAKQVTGEILVAVEDGEYVSVKSLTKLLSLGAVHGQRLTFIAKADSDAANHLQTLVAAVSEGLGEEVNKPAATLPSAAVPKLNREPISIEYGVRQYAISASQGLAIGEAYLPKQQQYQYPMTASDAGLEIDKLHTAIMAVKADLQGLIADSKRVQIAQIFSAHLALLEDDEVLTGANAAINDGMSAPAAWSAFIEQLAKAQASLGNALLAERAQDIKDVGQKVLLKLLGKQADSLPDSPYVLIKEDLLPSDVAMLDPARVAGIITATGGASSHSAIIARALGIAAVVGAGEAVLQLNNGEQVLLDGGEGWFVVNPSDEMVAQCQKTQQHRREQKRLAAEQAHAPAITTDGHRVEVAANLGNVGDATAAVANGAEGVGLLRTELVFMSHQEIPDIETQIADYEQVFDALAGKPLVVRVLDIGGDKALPYLPMAAEENPFLGLRGIRLLLEQPELLRNQLIALIRAAKGRDLRIMFPMIGCISQWRAARAMVDEVLTDYPHEALQVGMMLEVPSAAVLAHQFAKEVDFFSMGTNDLTQYVLAIDRGHPVLSKQADGLHPSVLTLINQAVQAAHAHGKWVGVCGELAADAKAVPILVGLGVDELSMSGGAIALVKAQIRSLDFGQAQALAKQALACQSAEEVRQLVGEWS
ncbi:phosphocarrier protein FPr [Moraxella cuniculi DSM 21768]|uniref:phosphoenolpyruvate--protein phosphotransferase n=1 Tax=Moraxella cuniculi DSM 21768 TaxID=1122245 RepID=A0A1N7EIC1_9GAMM|nr:phosphoenolpyruvate--protein phosphotransferase [Moraxella cuniculi]OOS07260.1 phosphoenolpyruvate--protein phosphotransferase [Moraxella cuniculi]SIR87820.1 phosphocarrier protein FPr [Moraxella cuniculi DSM 21768]